MYLNALNLSCILALYLKIIVYSSIMYILQNLNRNELNVYNLRNYHARVIVNNNLRGIKYIFNASCICVSECIHSGIPVCCLWCCCMWACIYVSTCMLLLDCVSDIDRVKRIVAKYNYKPVSFKRNLQAHKSCGGKFLRSTLWLSLSHSKKAWSYFWLSKVDKSCFPAWVL